MQAWHSANFDTLIVDRTSRGSSRIDYVLTWVKRSLCTSLCRLSHNHNLPDQTTTAVVGQLPSISGIWDPISIAPWICAELCTLGVFGRSAGPLCCATAEEKLAIFVHIRSRITSLHVGVPINMSYSF
jgi:hypothetical protein